MGKKILDSYPHLKHLVVVQQREGRVCIAGKKFQTLVSVEPDENRGPTKLGWNLTLAAFHKLDAAAIHDDFISSTPSRASADDGVEFTYL